MICENYWLSILESTKNLIVTWSVFTHKLQVIEHTMTQKIRMKLIILEEGPFLYDQNTRKVYACKTPHKNEGYLRESDLTLVRTSVKKE